MKSRLVNPFILLLAVSSLLVGCATTERVTAIEAQQVQMASNPYAGKRVSVSIGKFQNQSTFHRGIFSDGVDQLGNQAKTILIAHLNQSGRFGVLDRANLVEAQQEARFKNQEQAIKGAEFLVTGDVTEFGRKEVGDQQLFGILGRGKEQISYAKVTLNIVNANTSEVVYSAQGAGEYALSNRELIGFGSTSSYDSTLNGKVLDLALRQAVDNLARGVDNGALGVSGK
jgi:curli biogenesis system outer membrane secretion channel CsgG